MASHNDDYYQGDDDDVMRVLLQPALPCGMYACGRPASMALAEPDRTHAGLWSLLPVCTECAARLQRHEATPATYENAEPPVRA